MSRSLLNRDSQSTRSAKAFTIVEIICAIFLLAVVAITCVAIVANRDTQGDKTAAVSGAPAAIDALSSYFDNKAAVDALNAEIVAGGAARVVCRVQGDADALWQVVDSDEFASMKGVVGPVYVATLTNPKLYDKARAVEFDVAMGWIAPGLATEDAAGIRNRLTSSAALCKYRAIILRK